MKKINDIKNQSIEDEVKTNKPWVIIIALIVLSIFLCGLYFYFITNYTNVEIPRKDIRSLENTITKLEGSIKENKKNFGLTTLCKPLRLIKDVCRSL